MEQTLHDVGEILLQAIPTFLLVLFLFIYLKATFFGPMGKVLSDRKQATEGARADAAASLRKADERAAAYEDALRAAKTKLYKELEDQRNGWRSEGEAQIAGARSKAEALVAAAKRDLANEAAEAKRSLGQGTQALADQITAAVLEGRPR